MIIAISFTYAQREPPALPQRGRTPRLVLRGRRRPLLYAIGRLTADCGTRGRDRHDAARAPPPRGQPDRGRPDARRPRRKRPRRLGGRRSSPRRDRRPAWGPPADALLPHRRRDAHAAGAPPLPLPSPRRRADPRRGRAPADRAPAAHRRAGPRAAVRV